MSPYAASAVGFIAGVFFTLTMVWIALYYRGPKDSGDE